MTAPIGDPTPDTPAQHDAPRTGTVAVLTGPPSGYAKAIIGGLGAGIAALATALPDGVTGPEWCTVALAVLAVFSGTFAATNK